MTFLDRIRKNNLGFLFRSSPHEPGLPILRIQDMTVDYESGPALDRLNFELQVGERLAVVGPNGAGKSTLFKVIAGVLTPSRGMVEVYGHEPGGHICIAYVPQRSQVDWNFPATVADVVMMGRVGKMGYFRWPTTQDWNIVRQSLEVVNLESFSKRQISQLSGGQQQRMFIARALAQEAELVLMDEPLTGLDLTSQEDIFRILDSLRQRKVTVMVALHDLKIAAERFNRVMLLNHRLIGLGAPDEVFQPERLLEAYGGRVRMVSDGEDLLALGDSCCEEGDHHHD